MSGVVVRMRGRVMLEGVGNGVRTVVVRMGGGGCGGSAGQLRVILVLVASW